MADVRRRDADASSSESEGRRRRKGQTRSEHDRRPRGGAVDQDEHRSGDFKRESRVSRSKEDRHSRRHRRGSDEGSDKEGRGRTRRHEDRRHRHNDSGSDEEDRHDRHSRREQKRISSSDEEGIFRGRERPRGDDRMHRVKDRHNGKEDAKGRREDGKEEEALPPPPPFPPLVPEANSAKGRVRRYEDSHHRRSDSGSGEDDRHDRHRRRERKRISSSDEEEGIFRGRERPRGDDRMLREKDRQNGKEDAKGRREDGKEEALPPPPPFPPLVPEANSAKGKVRRYEDNRHRRSDSGSGEDDRHRRRERKRISSSDEEEGIFRGRERPRGDDRMHREKDRHNGKEDAKGRREDSKEEEVLPPPPPFPPLVPDANSGRSGGIYIPPFRMAQMLKDVTDKSGEAYQRLSWDALRKSINGLVNKVNATNIKNIIPELFSENLIRGRGLFCRSCMKSQMASPAFTDVFAALVAVVNTKFPEVGKLLLKRIVLQLKRAYKRNDKPQLLAATKFIAHLVNQQVAHEIVALELLTVLLENPTVDSVEVAVGFVKECGALLQDFSSKGLHGIFERFRGILHEGEIEKRVGYLIEELFAIRKAKFQGFPAIRPELDLVEQEDQLTHETSLEDEIDPETHLDVFKPNPQFLDDEKVYEDLKKNILGADSSEEEGSESASDEEDEEESEEEEEEQMKIKDETETNLINLRRTIYLTIMSSVDFEEAGHKLLKIKLEPGQEMELCIMLLECCSQERTYLRYYGLLGQRFCMINKVYQENFETCFVQQYSMIHRLETNKLRNVAKFFAHLLGTSALPWHVLSYIRLTEEDTTSSSRIFIKILFQELSEHLGIRLLNERLNEPTMKDSFESIFPKDNPKNTRFSINFFTSIGLGGITESLREYLKSMPSRIMQQQKPVPESEDESESNGTSSSDSSSSDSDTGSDSETESSSDERNKRSSKRRRRN